MFADDAVLISSDADVNKLVKNLEEDLVIVTMYFAVLKLSLNKKIIHW